MQLHGYIRAYEEKTYTIGDKAKYAAKTGNFVEIAEYDPNRRDDEIHKFISITIPGGGVVIVSKDDIRRAVGALT